jgi:DNA-binding protein Fis
MTSTEQTSGETLWSDSVDNAPSSSQISSSVKELTKEQPHIAALGSGLVGATAAKGEFPSQIDHDLAVRLDKHSLEAIVELKISRFLDQIGTFYPEDLHSLIIKKVEKPLLGQILRRMGGNQVHASKILGINRNTLRKKMKLYGF